MSSLTILHLSDLHYSKKIVEPTKTVVAGLLKDISHMKDKYGLNPDLFFFTGDMVLQGEDSSELFKWVSGNVVDPVLDQLRLSEERFFCVPGNHEIDRSKVYEALEHGLAGQLSSPEAFEQFYETLDYSSTGYSAIMEKLSSYRTFAESYRKESLVTDNHFYSGYRLEINGLSIGIGCLNSAWRSSHFGTDEGRLIVGRSLVQNLATQLTGADIKLALCHHPFEWLCSWDAKQVRRRVSREFDILFNGHVHDAEPSAFEESFGKFYTSTAGCLREDALLSHYSIIHIDLAARTITCYLRKWYDERGIFDQQTEKAADGIVTFNDFQCANPEISEHLQLHKHRQSIGDSLESAQLVNPWEGIIELTLNDVFVEPVICNTSSLNRVDDDPHVVPLLELLEDDANVFFFGRQESGKTMLLQHIQETLLRDKPKFEKMLPVHCKFSQLPRNNPNSYIGLICNAIGNTITADEAAELLAKGRITFLIDDLGDKNNRDFSKRCTTLIAFLKVNPKTRIIATLSEQISQQTHSDVLTLQNALSARSVYIWPFTTAKLKQLLSNMSKARSIDVNRMLEQIVFYFHHLQIPVTPLAATLFIGVLFRDSKQKNIQNEAYLIENYLESILEKLDKGGSLSALDFREKESFLAHIAWVMVQREVTTLTAIEFEEVKLAYFKELDEPLPSSKIFTDFFKKGILINNNGIISFKFRFWFFFFIAKSLEKSLPKQNALLERPDYLSFSTAFSYKAGLTRNDLELLETFGTRLDTSIATLGEYLGLESGQITRIDSQLHAAGEAITEKLSNKLSEVTFEASSDSRFSFDSSNEVAMASNDDSRDDLGELLTLHADVLRNTREVSGDDKYRHVIKSVEGFLSLMWGALSGVESMVDELGEADLERLFFHKMVTGDQKERLKKMLTASQRMVFQLVPVSFAFYMSDHLCNPKLANIFIRCGQQAKTDGERLFYNLLLFKCSPKQGLPFLHKFAEETPRGPGDMIASLFLRVYAYETPMNDDEISNIISLMDSFRKKSVTKVYELPPLMKDTYREEMKHSILAKQKTKGGRKPNKVKKKRKKSR